MDHRLPEHPRRLSSKGPDVPDRDKLGMRAFHSIARGAVDRARRGSDEERVRGLAEGGV